jgi:hypothetical protein
MHASSHNICNEFRDQHHDAGAAAHVNQPDAAKVSCGSRERNSTDTHKAASF